MYHDGLKGCPGWCFALLQCGTSPVGHHWGYLLSLTSTSTLDRVGFADSMILLSCQDPTCRISLQWRRNGRDGVSNHQPRDCLLNRLFRHRWKKHQSPASPAFVRGIHRSPVNSPHKWPVTRKMFPFDDVIMFTPDENCVHSFHCHAWSNASEETDSHITVTS